jgi:hypothetical protein
MQLQQTRQCVKLKNLMGYNKLLYEAAAAALVVAVVTVVK